MKQILAKIEKEEYLISLDNFKEFCPNLNLRTRISKPVWMKNILHDPYEGFESRKGDQLDYYLL